MRVTYPEPIPAIKGEDVEGFLRRLENFSLTPAQKELYRGCREFYLRLRPR